jgi:hypothetical protein
MWGQTKTMPNKIFGENFAISVLGTEIGIALLHLHPSDELQQSQTTLGSGRWECGMAIERGKASSMARRG